MKFTSTADLEDLVLATSPSIRRSVERAQNDLRLGRGVALEDHKRRSLPKRKKRS